MQTSEIIGYVATLVSVFAFVPQVIQCFRTRETKDVSLPSLLILITSSILWFSYGLVVMQIPIILTNGIIGMLVFTLILMKLRWG